MHACTFEIGNRQVADTKSIFVLILLVLKLKFNFRIHIIKLLFFI